MLASAQEAMKKVMGLPLADPGRVYHEALQTRHLIEQARDQVASFLGALNREVIFTSGATESIHFAAMASERFSTPTLVSAIEHSTVLQAASRSEEVEILPVDHLGQVVVDALEDLCEVPRLVHVQHANPEIGTIQDIPRIASIVHRHGGLLHVDAAASVGRLPVDFHSLGADMMSVSSHKFGGPSGIGALVIKKGLRIPSLLRGSPQERGRRAGLEAVPLISGFAAACHHLNDQVEALAATSRLLREHLEAWISSQRHISLMSCAPNRLDQLVLLNIEGIEGEALVLGLNRRGIAIHSGSACSSETFEPSHVLAAIGQPASSPIRVSIGAQTTDDDLEHFCVALAQTCDQLRGLTSLD